MKAFISKKILTRDINEGPQMTVIIQDPIEDSEEDSDYDPGEDPDQDPDEDPGQDPGENPGQDPGQDPDLAFTSTSINIDKSLYNELQSIIEELTAELPAVYHTNIPFNDIENYFEYKEHSEELTDVFYQLLISAYFIYHYNDPLISQLTKVNFRLVCYNYIIYQHVILSPIESIEEFSEILSEIKDIILSIDSIDNMNLQYINEYPIKIIGLPYDNRCLLTLMLYLEDLMNIEPDFLDKVFKNSDDIINVNTI
jgi:hypothetical protein